MFIRAICSCLLIASLCIIATSVYAAQPQEKTPQENLLKVGDKIAIFVEGEESLSGNYIINKAGNINMPLIGKILVAGRTEHEAKMLITRQLKDGYLHKPDVLVKNQNPPVQKVEKKPAQKTEKKALPCPSPPVSHAAPKHKPKKKHKQQQKRRAAKHVYIVGEVNNPGYYPLPPKAGHILNIIALAGGYKKNADTSNFELVRNIEGAYYRKQAQSGALEYHDGDIIIIKNR